MDPGGVPGPQMGAGLLGPDRVINPVHQQRQQSDVLLVNVICRHRRRSRGLFFSHPIRPRKSDQAGIDGVGEHRREHCVPESERR